MSDSFRQKVLSSLIQEIGIISGGRFEQFCYRIMCHIFPGNWVERGTTVSGAPRGYTIDSSLNGTVYAAEMSSDADYFNGDMKKPKHDLNHALKMHPNVKRIWLLSSQEASAGETTERAELESSFVRDYPSVEQVDILDSRQIAEFIYSNLHIESLVYEISSYVPSVGRLADEYAFSHSIPSFPRYQSRADLEQAVIQRLQAESVVSLNGISGIGKSALAAQVALMSRDFDIRIWVDAYNLESVRTLSDIDIRRTGTRHNIIGLLRNHKCLLILDDSKIPWEQLHDLECGEFSKIMITSQITSDPKAIVVNNLDYNAARSVLESKVSSPCPDDVFNHVFDCVGGYPLLLNLLNSIALHDGWCEVERCCVSAVSAMEDEKHVKVCHRILQRHEHTLSSELQFVKWCNSARFDPELSSICVHSLAIKNLTKRGFIAASSAGYIRIHDIVFQAICNAMEVTAQNDKKFCDKLDEYISTRFGEHNNIIKRLANFHSPLVRKLLSHDARPSFVYAAALVRDEELDIDLFGNLIEKAEELSRRRDWIGREIEIRAIMEAVEAIYTIVSRSRGVDAAKESIQKNIRALDILKFCPAATSSLQLSIRHHYAKLLYRLDRVEDAKNEFLSILAEDPSFAAARLQLARILSKRHNNSRKSEALAHCKRIITQNQDVSANVPISILLEALHLLARIGNSNDLRSYHQLIVSCLKDAREIDHALALRLMATVAQKTWFTAPELVLEMYESIEWRDVVANNNADHFDWAQSHKSAAKIMRNDDSKRNELLKSAVEHYCAISDANSYQLTQQSEAYLLLQDYDNADKVLESVPKENRGAFWLQRKAQTLLGMDKAREAISAINQGIDQVKGERYYAAFLHVRFQARQQLEDIDATEDLKLAIESLPDRDKYRVQLENELKQLTT